MVFWGRRRRPRTFLHSFPDSKTVFALYFSDLWTNGSTKYCLSVTRNQENNHRKSTYTNNPEPKFSKFSKSTYTNNLEIVLDNFIEIVCLWCIWGAAGAPELFYTPFQLLRLILHYISTICERMGYEIPIWQ